MVILTHTPNGKEEYNAMNIHTDRYTSICIYGMPPSGFILAVFAHVIPFTGNRKRCLKLDSDSFYFHYV